MSAERKLKVYYLGTITKAPGIQLAGEWLKQLGFAAGDKISVKCESGKLVICKG